ncbi:hypothetical protein DPMN_041700 [Dreissena polymorpha]|uniref:Sushi domain-containing protein n=1 Tax=Dreissena polymorpha TaxID=45954 RepID=A0A9D4CZ99_DREPO|nr:hypothetical protein DPMN_041700 [Dreissena polymorpha]
MLSCNLASIASFLLSDCGIPSADNGNVTPMNGTLFGAVAKVTCNAGYSSTGDAELVCGHPGWMGNASCDIQGMC